MKNIIRIACLLAVAVGFCSRLIADEYLTLTAKVEYADIVILDKKASDYSGTYYEKALEERKQIVANSGNKIVDESVLNLKKGEVVELSHMFHVAAPYGSLPRYDELSGHSWWGRELYPESNGGYKLEVKYPGLDNWHRLHYDPGSKDWTGLGTTNPVIVGPCTLKLTKNAHIVFYETSNHGNQSNMQRYATTYAGGIVWATLKKVKTTSFSTPTTAQSLVLPEGSGDLSIIMEGSNDLINWTREELGKKPEANRKTFYRIRAVKE